MQENLRQYLLRKKDQRLLPLQHFCRRCYAEFDTDKERDDHLLLDDCFVSKAVVESIVDKELFNFGGGEGRGLSASRDGNERRQRDRSERRSSSSDKHHHRERSAKKSKKRDLRHRSDDGSGSDDAKKSRRRQKVSLDVQISQSSAASAASSADPIAVEFIDLCDDGTPDVKISPNPAEVFFEAAAPRPDNFGLVRGVQPSSFQLPLPPVDHQLRAPPPGYTPGNWPPLSQRIPERIELGQMLTMVSFLLGGGG